MSEQNNYSETYADCSIEKDKCTMKTKFDLAYNLSSFYEHKMYARVTVSHLFMTPHILFQVL